MVIIAKTHFSNTTDIERWEFGYGGTWSTFIEEVKASGMITDYYDFLCVANGVVIFVSKNIDEELGVMVRTYRLKY